MRSQGAKEQVVAFEAPTLGVEADFQITWDKEPHHGMTMFSPLSSDGFYYYFNTKTPLLRVDGYYTVDGKRYRCKACRA